MATLGNRQNLTDAELANAVQLYDAKGHADEVGTKAANDVIFHTNNEVTSVIQGSVVKNVAATVVKQAASKAAILAGRK